MTRDSQSRGFFCLKSDMNRMTRRAGVFPVESNTKTIAKRARVEPRRQMHMTMKIMFWMRKPSISLRWSPIISLSYVMKLWTWLINREMTMSRKSSIGLKFFQKFKFLVEISRILKNLEILVKPFERRACPTSYPSGNQVDGSPLVAIPKHS